MTHEEAKNTLDKYIPELNGDWGEIYRVCADALDKQIPKKPYIEDGEELCPACKSLFISILICEIDTKKTLDYCPVCGQKIDWT